MRIRIHKDPIAHLIGNPSLDTIKLVFSTTERQALEKAWAILAKASDTWDEADCEPDENPFLRATELRD